MRTNETNYRHWNPINGKAYADDQLWMTTMCVGMMWCASSSVSFLRRLHILKMKILTQTLLSDIIVNLKTFCRNLTKSLRAVDFAFFLYKTKLHAYKALEQSFLSVTSSERIFKQDNRSSSYQSAEMEWIHMKCKYIL